MKAKHFITAIYLLTINFLLAQDNYNIDKGHTNIGFSVERFLVGEVVGRFNDYEANISMNGEDKTSLKMSATIKVESLNSNNETRDGHLKGEIWLDQQNYPEIKFVSTEIFEDNNKVLMMKGDFTIKGVTKEVVFPVEILGPFKDPTQKTAIGVKADFSINRFDYNIKFDRKMDNGSFFIGEDVNISIRALAYKD